MAREFDLPVILHVRKAHADMLAILKQQQLARAGVVHAFNGSLEQAREYIKLGFMLGIGGAYTWPQARKLRRMLPQLPLDPPCCPACRWNSWCWKPTARTCPRYLLPDNAISQTICRKLPLSSPNYTRWN